MQRKPVKTGTALGVDIGGTKLKALALTSDDQIIKELTIPSRAEESPQGVRDAIHEVVSFFQSQSVSFDFIGAGCAGSVHFSEGVVRNSPNFAHWKNIPLRDWIQQDFGVPAVVENDANCAVFSEYRLGAGKGYENLVLLTLGTGIGGGLILGGQLFRGTTGTAGELGHLTIHSEGLECPCGNRGCFERYCSATAVKLKAKGISPKEVFSKAQIVPEYKKIMDEFIHHFQVGLVGVANVFDPQCILLGGAVTDGLSLYLDSIRGWVRTHAFPAVGSQLEIKTTYFKNLSGALGAALLAREGIA